MLYILPFNAEAATTLELTGGKGANLTRMSRAELPVPNGFIITTEAYQAFVNANSLKEVVKGSIEGVDMTSPDDLERASSEIRRHFRSGTFPSGLLTEIQNAYRSLSSPEVAVRSSATAEDLPDLSFAGQQDTYLNICNETQLQKSVAECFGSLWTGRAIGYREKAEIDHTCVSLAVVVQIMVPSESSGVMFTANPLNDRRDQMTLEVISGLGEALVSGLTQPDGYILKKDGTILDQRIGANSVTIRPLPGGGTEKVEETPSQEPILKDHQVRELAQLCVKVENLFGYPQDIEWAYADGIFHLVQSRPITTLFPLPSTPPTITSPQIFLSFSTIQGMLRPFTPLGEDAIRNIFGGLTCVFIGKTGLVERKRSIIQNTAGRLYINATFPLRNRFFRNKLSKFLTIVGQGISQGVQEVLNDECFQPVNGMSWNLWKYLVPLFFFSIFRLVNALIWPESGRKHAENAFDGFIQSIQNRSLLCKSLHDWLDLFEDGLGSFFSDVFPRIFPRFGLGLLSLFHLKSIAHKIPDGDNLVLTLTRSIPHNPTTEMDLCLWDTAKVILSDQVSLDFFLNSSSCTLANAYLTGAMPRVAYDAIESIFMKRYGMRGVAEIDFGRPRWRENPAPLMESLKSYLRIEEEHAPDRIFSSGAKVAQDATDRLGLLLGRPLYIKFLARRIRALLGLRERPKFTIIQVMGIMRSGFLDQGLEFVAKGILEHPEDIFYLHVEELRGLADGEKRDWKGIVTSRRNFETKEMKRKRIPHVIVSDGRMFYEGSAKTVQDTADVLAGEAVSPGTVEGLVRVVHDPHHANLHPGEILVCQGTDPAWTPLFLTARGLVTEVGGLMTHGSVVSREYGIPAVVGVSRATERLVTGQRVQVDGTTGKVILLEKPKN